MCLFRAASKGSQSIAPIQRQRGLSTSRPVLNFYPAKIASRWPSDTQLCLLFLSRERPRVGNEGIRIPSMETTMNGHEWLRRGDPFLIPSKYLKTNTSLACESQLTPPPNHRRARLEFRLLLAEVVQPGFCGVPGNQMPDALQPGC